MSVPPRTRYFRSKLSTADLPSSGRAAHARLAFRHRRQRRTGTGPARSPSATLARLRERYFAGACAAPGTGDICWTAPAPAAAYGRGPSSQLNRLVLSRMKWISRASAKRKVNKATSVRRGSKRSQMRHMSVPPLRPLRQRAQHGGHVLQHGRVVAVRPRQPGTPLPSQEVRDDRDHDEDDEARHEDAVELLRLGLGQPRERPGPFLQLRSHAFTLLIRASRPLPRTSRAADIAAAGSASTARPPATPGGRAGYPM